jgi:hypothetical protein
VCPPPFSPGGRAHSLAAKGVGESQFQQRDIHCGALIYIYKYFVVKTMQEREKMCETVA